jgi:hypothetical protein
MYQAWKWLSSVFCVILTLTSGSLEHTRLFAGSLNVEESIPSGKVNSKFASRVGMVNLDTISTNVFPMQTRYPPENGEKL